MKLYLKVKKFSSTKFKLIPAEPLPEIPARNYYFNSWNQVRRKRA